MTPPIPARVAQRAATRYTVDGDCWISTYSTGSHGYAQIGWQNGPEHYGTTAHRAAWTHYYGAIPDSMTVDHTCRVRKCVRPGHLRLLPNLDNATDNGSSTRRVLPTTGTRCSACGGTDVVLVGVRKVPTCRPCRSKYRREWRAHRRANGLSVT